MRADYIFVLVRKLTWNCITQFVYKYFISISAGTTEKGDDLPSVDKFAKRKEGKQHLKTEIV